MIPMSFDVMKTFQDAGFTLKELIIKEQHNCKATGYWKTNSVKYNFLLIAHDVFVRVQEMIVKENRIYAQPLVEMGVSFTELAIKATATAVTNKIKAVKEKRISKKFATLYCFKNS